MIRPIVPLGEPVLRAPTRALGRSELSSEELRGLVRDMFETLTESGGVGLAAPQVGVSLRVILAGSFPSTRAPDRPLVPTRALVNPRIVWASEETHADWEGCLSFRRFRVRVPRSQAI